VTAVIADTDILSTFGKIGRLDLLQLLFDQVYIAPAVERELGRATQLGFTWVISVQRTVLLLPLTANESGAVARLTSLYPQLGSGEIESFVLAQTHHLAYLTNDRQAKVVAQALGLSYLDLEDLLRAIKTRKLLTTAALTALIAQIEEHEPHAYQNQSADPQ
jgi:predicted nucleic acid-binding protein